MEIFDTLVMQTTIGTLRAKATARCSFDMPITPALAPITRITQDGAPEVKPYKVVLRYLSWPARSDNFVTSGNISKDKGDLPINVTIFAERCEISSQPS